MGPLAAYWKTTAVTHAPIGSHLDVALHVHRKFLAKVTFHRAFLFQNLPNAGHFIFVEVADSLSETNAGAMKDRPRPG